jgi:DNA-binding response OmpR family regulator
MRLLVVDDEARLIETLQRGLQGEGYLVDTATDGEQGYQLACGGEYDAIVLDLMLPKLSGYQVCQRLRRAGDWTPVLMLTAKDGEYDEADGLDSGADDYLTKPFSYVVLTARIRALVRRGRAARPTELRVGDLVLDPATRRCTRGDIEVPLTSKEYAVLDALMRSAGQVLGKQQILDQVWDVNDDRPDNLVEVYVSMLRRKIDVPFGRTSIRTVRGSGYQIVRDPATTPESLPP